MDLEQARNNLLALVNHDDLKLSFRDHMVLRQSITLLYDKAKEAEEDKKECQPPQANTPSET